MEIKYKILYQETVVREEIPGLSPSTKLLTKRAIEERLMRDPIGFGKPLRYSLKGHRRLRVSDYRVIYRIEEGGSVIIVAIRHRKDVYED